MRFRTLTIAALLAVLGSAEVIDRIVATVGDLVVTEGAVRRQIRMAALLVRGEPDYSDASRKQAIERLINQALIRKEIEISRYSAPALPEVEKRIEDYLTRNKMTHEDFDALLKRYQFTEEDFKQEAQWQITLARFIEFRFRPGVVITDAEIEKYYSATFIPQFKKRNPAAELPPLEDVRDQINRILATEASTEAMDKWLEQTRQQTKIRMIEPEPQSPAAVRP